MALAGVVDCFFFVIDGLVVVVIVVVIAEVIRFSITDVGLGIVFDVGVVGSDGGVVGASLVVPFP